MLEGVIEQCADPEYSSQPARAYELLKSPEVELLLRGPSPHLRLLIVANDLMGISARAKYWLHRGDLNAQFAELLKSTTTNIMSDMQPPEPWYAPGLSIAQAYFVRYVLPEIAVKIDPNFDIPLSKRSNATDLAHYVSLHMANLELEMKATSSSQV